MTHTNKSIDNNNIKEIHKNRKKKHNFINSKYSKEGRTECVKDTRDEGRGRVNEPEVDRLGKEGKEGGKEGRRGERGQAGRRGGMEGGRKLKN